jgi:hypothetical protein
MDVLTRQHAPPRDLLRELCSLYGDQTQDVVTRDYALQSLATACAGAVGELAQDGRMARETLWAAVGETGSSLGGTALLGLQRLARGEPGSADRRLDEATLRLVEDGSAGQLARVTALSVCAERGLTAALPTALEVARSGSSVSERAAAIAAVGELGGRPERALLEALEAGGENSLRPAVKSALRRLNQRLNETKEQG